MCISPNTFRQQSTGNIITVPCGRCYQCIRKRKLDWQIRIMSELSSSDCAFFSLVSYNEENLPDPPIADKASLQLLIKRLRKYLSDFYGATMKYFIVSEYGEMRNRLHYHCIFFIRGVDIDRYQWKILLEDKWSKGFCSAFNLDMRWASYACKYIQKQYNMMMYSRLGKDSYIKANGKVFDTHPYRDTPLPAPSFPMGGKMFSVPRSWRESMQYSVNIDGVSAVLGQEYLSARAQYLKDNPPKSKLSYSDQLLLQEKFLYDNPTLQTEERVRFDDSVFENNPDF